MAAACFCLGGDRQLQKPIKKCCRTWACKNRSSFWETVTFAEETGKPECLIRDYDSKFGTQFDEVMRGENVEVIKVGPRAPNLNAHAERFVLSIKSECLDHFTVFGEKHLRHLLSEYLTHYHEECPHQGTGNMPLTELSPPTLSEGRSDLADC